MLLDVTITPLTSLPTAHPSAEAVRGHASATRRTVPQRSRQRVRRFAQRAASARR